MCHLFRDRGNFDPATAFVIRAWKQGDVYESDAQQGETPHETEETMNGWMEATGAALVLVFATAATGQAQQRSMMGGQMHADTTPSATPCPGGMGMMGMMQGHGMMGGMHGMSGTMRGMAGDSAGTMQMRRGMGPGMMGGGMMSGRGMMGMMGASPSMLLAQRDVLELNDDQVTRLEQLREEQQGMMKGMHQGMMAARMQMQDATGADSLAMDAYREAVEAMADQMVSHHMQMARFRKQVLDVLTPEQREKLQTGMEMMCHMMGGRGMGGPMQ